MERSLVLVSVIGLVLALGYLAEAMRYSWGTLARPGSGVYPVLVGVLLAASCIGICVEGLLRRSGVAASAWPAGAALARAGGIVSVSLGYILFLPYVGHLVAATVVALVVLRAMGLIRWWLLGSLGVALAVGTHFLFAVWLRVPLPQGVWFE